MLGTVSHIDTTYN